MNLLIQQVRREDNDKDISCPNCKKTFKWKASLNQHLKIIHQEPEIASQDKDIEEDKAEETNQ